PPARGPARGISGTTSPAAAAFARWETATAAPAAASRRDSARPMPPLPPVTRATRPSRGCSAPTRRSHDLHLARCCCAEVMDRAHHCCPLGGAARRPGGLVRVDDRQVLHARHLEAHQAYNTTASSLASPPLERE